MFALNALFMGALLITAQANNEKGLTQVEIEKSQYADKRLVILQSTSDFQEAKSTAESAAIKLGIPLRLSEVSPHTKLGLTNTKSDCNDSGVPWPCYFPRGRHDDGAYVSIEYSNAFQGYTEGFFIVVAASAPKNDEVIQQTLDSAKSHWPTAYSKNTPVYLGCMQ